MYQHGLVVENTRFFLNDDKKYVINGIIPDGYTVAAYLDEKELPLELIQKTVRTTAERFAEEGLGGRKRVRAVITFPEDLKNYKRLRVYAVHEKKREDWFHVQVEQLLREQGRPQFYIDQERVLRDSRTLLIQGWAAAGEPVKIRLYDEKKRPLDVKINKNLRLDVVDLFEECEVPKDCGFAIEAEEMKGRYAYLVMSTKSGAKTVYKVNLTLSGILFGKVLWYQKKGIYYLRKHGMQAFFSRAVKEMTDRDQLPMEYWEWLPKHLPSEQELQKQRERKFDRALQFSVVTSVDETMETSHVREMVDSMKQQSYENWELCIGAGENISADLKAFLKECAAGDRRIRVVFAGEKPDTAKKIRVAAELAEGEYILFAGARDMFTGDALYECASVLEEDPETEVLYSDEDKVSRGKKKYYDPNFKPDFNLDLLCTTNYISHLFAVKKELLDKTGLFRPEFSGAQEYDLIFRCIEQTRRIHHIPRILYHTRENERPDGKEVLEAGMRAVQAHFDRIGIKARIRQGLRPGLYHTEYIRDYDPLVSIIIPTKDHIEDLQKCIRSVEERSTYKNVEYIIVENNSTQKETFEYYKKLEAENPKVKIVYWENEFNYSRINNFGVQHSSGEYLLLLNNDVEVINEDWIEELLGYSMRKDVGIVGARLFYDDDTVQHAGVVLGFGEIAGHCFVQQPREIPGYQNRIISAQDYSAVTAACMMVRRDVFEEVGGLSEDLAVAFNDVDFCLKVGAAGYLVVYNPYVQLYHYESKSRGLEDTPEKKARFAVETATLKEHWPEAFMKTDPYYNPNLTLKRQDFSLKRI